jgi:6-phosphogluconolactonase
MARRPREPLPSEVNFRGAGSFAPARSRDLRNAVAFRAASSRRNAVTVLLSLLRNAYKPQSLEDASMMTVTCPDNEQLFDAAAERLAAQLSHVLSSKGVCCLGIVGGRSSPAVLTRLSRHVADLRGRIEVFWLDERVVADGKNYLAVLPALQTMKDAGIDVAWYALASTTLDGILQDCEHAMDRMRLLCSGEPRFDAVLLSAGEDGHVASLFPHHATLARTELAYLIEEESPKEPPVRITISPDLIRTATHAVLLVVGDKRAVAQQLTDPSVPIEECPAKLALSADECVVFVNVQ